MKLIISFILLFAFAVNSFAGSKLIYKTEVTFSADKKIDIPLINTAQYDRIRISATNLIIPFEGHSNEASRPILSFALYEANEPAGFLSDMVFNRAVETFIYDAPTSQLKITAQGQGKVKILVWGIS